MQRADVLASIARGHVDALVRWAPPHLGKQHQQLCNFLADAVVAAVHHQLLVLLCSPEPVGVFTGVDVTLWNQRRLHLLDGQLSRAALCQAGWCELRDGVGISWSFHKTSFLCTVRPCLGAWQVLFSIPRSLIIWRYLWRHGAHAPTDGRDGHDVGRAEVCWLGRRRGRAGV